MDKTFPIIPSSTLIDFAIGPIPFKVSFEIPLTVQANAMMHSIAEAEFGVTSQYARFSASRASGSNSLVQVGAGQHVCVLGRDPWMVTRHSHSHILVAAAAENH